PRAPSFHERHAGGPRLARANPDPDTHDPTPSRPRPPPRSGPAPPPPANAGARAFLSRASLAPSPSTPLGSLMTNPLAVSPLPQFPDWVAHRTAPGAPRELFCALFVDPEDSVHFLEPAFRCGSRALDAAEGRPSGGPGSGAPAEGGTFASGALEPPLVEAPAELPFPRPPAEQIGRAHV